MPMPSPRGRVYGVLNSNEAVSKLAGSSSITQR